MNKNAGGRWRRSLWGLGRKAIRVTVLGFVGLHAFWAVCLLGLRFVNPFTTGVQIQRRAEAWIHWTDYDKHSQWMPLDKISPNLQHAVIASEDGRFYEHYGVDWQRVQEVVEDYVEDDRPLIGASTITQQLMKNLFFTTHRNPLRKMFEYTLAPMATVILGRQRILELYLNVAEWGPGVWGAEAAAQYHYRGRASRLTRDQAARLAAILPSPRRRRPASMNRFSASIEARMSQHGW